MTGLLAGKKLLVTGIITDRSIAYAVARLALEQQATVVVTGYSRLSLVRRVVRRLPGDVPVVELDVTRDADLTSLADRVAEHVPHLDGVLHSIAYAPPNCLGGNFLAASWPDVSTALHVSAYSLPALASAALPLLRPGACVLGLDFDASVAWSMYDWMGVAKAALESSARYLARELGPLGVRVNLVAAGPLRTQAAMGIPGFEEFEQEWVDRSPLGWSVTDVEPVARTCVALLSDWLPATTGEIIHADGGRHAIGG